MSGLRRGRAAGFRVGHALALGSLSIRFCYVDQGDGKC